MAMAEDDPNLAAHLYRNISLILDKTVFGKPITEGQVALLATEPGLTAVTTPDKNFVLQTADGGKFVLTRKGKLLSDQTPVPHKGCLLDGKPAGYQIEYDYSGLEEGVIVQTNSYITPDGRVVKDVLHRRKPDGTVIKTLFYNKRSGELEEPDVKVRRKNGKPIKNTWGWSLVARTTNSLLCPVGHYFTYKI